MRHINRSLSLIALLAIALLILPSKTWAAEGIDVKIIAEWPVDIPTPISGSTTDTARRQLRNAYRFGVSPRITRSTWGCDAPIRRCR